MDANQLAQFDQLFLLTTHLLNKRDEFPCISECPYCAAKRDKPDQTIVQILRKHAKNGVME